MPIGVFDSGVGGLTVLHALRAQMPDHDFLYFADTARVPYGRKPREMVAGFARQISDFLLNHGVEAIVVACNTASAAALPALAAECPVPMWGVIEPGVTAAAAATRTGRVGVIGTRGTIASGAYQRALEAQGLTVWARACPMLVHIVEEGMSDSPEASLLVRHYLADRPDIDTLILGCTHYPVLRDTIARALGPAIAIVASDTTTANLVRNTIGHSHSHHSGTIRHYVSGDPAAYRHTAAVMGGLDRHIISGEIIPAEIISVDITRLPPPVASAPPRYSLEQT